MFSIVDVYKQLLLGELKRFPPYTWDLEKEAIDNFKKCFRYLIVEHLELSRESLLNILTTSFICKYKLTTPLERYLSSNAYYAVSITFPEWNVYPWELKVVPSGYWESIGNIVDGARTYCTINKITRTDLLKGAKEIGLERFTLAYRRLNKDKNQTDYYYDFLRTIYPEYNFRIWEFKRVTIDNWTDQDIRDGVIWFFETVLKWKKSEIINKINRDVFDNSGFAYIFKKKFNRDCASLLEFVYDEKFEELNNLSSMRAHTRKLSPKEVREIRGYYKDNKSKGAIEFLAGKYQVSSDNIVKICRRETWSNI
ncbi:DUF4046 domain-containing protein [Paenibacillus sp. HJL G12]|uniref:DUF4046 domain-containing protein n=1 Tax=Paenibacillus dendrobii TaxID=2691084 RepID=A0A7X3IJ07_9BACL|nr:DUF4046 domain-containing protein [Paenibacillus dendrobii]MWV44847.1 DUF4046 domain-containing protein [Paenibacillus dendrobii]